MTINKSQGQSVEHVGLDLRSSVFTHGQFYVGISRVTSVERIKAIWNEDQREAKTYNRVVQSCHLLVCLFIYRHFTAKIAISEHDR